MTTFDLWPLPLRGGAWGAGTNMWHPETPDSYESLPAPLATQIPTLCIHTSAGEGVGGSYIRSMSSIRPICKCWCPPLWPRLEEVIGTKGDFIRLKQSQYTTKQFGAVLLCCYSYLSCNHHFHFHLKTGVNTPRTLYILKQELLTIEPFTQFHNTDPISYRCQYVLNVYLLNI